MRLFMVIFVFVSTSLLVGCLPENEYKAKGELYQCFIDGKAIYKSNVSPEPRGGNWYKLNNDVIKVDDCYCMGCIGF